jgi:hypothetical protein
MGKRTTPATGTNPNPEDEGLGDDFAQRMYGAKVANLTEAEKDLLVEQLRAELGEKVNTFANPREDIAQVSEEAKVEIEDDYELLRDEDFDQQFIKIETIKMNEVDRAKYMKELKMTTIKTVDKKILDNLRLRHEAAKRGVHMEFDLKMKASIQGYVTDQLYAQKKRDRVEMEKNLAITRQIREHEVNREAQEVKERKRNAKGAREADKAADRILYEMEHPGKKTCCCALF